VRLHGLLRGRPQGSEGCRNAMMALWSMPVCYCNSRRVSLLYVSALGRDTTDLIDMAQMVQRSLKEVGLEAALKIQEYGAYQATTGQGKSEGMAMGPYGGGWEPDSPLYGPYTPDQPRNRGHVNDAKLAADGAGATAAERPEGAPAPHLRHAALCGGAAVLCKAVFPSHHGLLAAVCEELCSEPEHRLRQSRRGLVAGAVT
jgi:hypothetical protein